MPLRTSAFLMLLPILLSGAGTQPWCEATPGIRQELKRLQLPNSEGRGREQAQKEIVVQLLNKHADDLFVHLRYQRIFRGHTESERQVLIDRYQKFAESYPADSRYQFLYAEALLDKDTPRSIAIAQKIIATGPGFARAHLLLVDIYSYGKFADRPKARAELESFFKGCPAALDSKALSLLQRYGGQELAAQVAPELRKRLSTETDSDLLTQWEIVWNLEFKARPAGEHDQVRKQIAADLEKLRTSNAKPDASWLQLLRAGYRLAGNEPTAREQESKLLAEYPSSQEARHIDDDRWYKAHPWPGSDKVKQAEYWHAALVRAEEGLKKQPRNEILLMQQFQALSNLPDASVDQLTSSADALLTVLHEDRDFFASPPFEMQVARAYLKRKVRMEEVPRLVNEAWASHAYMEGAFSDRSSDDFLKMRASGDAYLTREAALVLTDAAQQLHKPKLAKEAVEKTAALKTEKPGDKSLQYTVEAKWAELQSRKLDALLLYRAALDIRPASQKPSADDELAKNFDRLWKELGGTDVSRTLLASKSKPEAATTDGRWEKPAKDMKSWQLSDLNGKTWKLASLEGKTLLINVWATWCGPCKAEHPRLQKLYDRIKNDPTIAIVTFNVDDEMGNVVPYLKENNYTFPVLFAKDYTDDLSVDSIPRNWIVDAKGKWQWQQIGFGGDDKWEDNMLAKLKETK
jgi:thiol-disulfide isomerase/thioredoxin